MSKLIVIAVANQKGGEGKTTTSINLSHGLALQGKKTLLVDMDPQGNSSGIFVDTDADSATASIFSSEKHQKDIVRRTKYERLSILPSNISLAEVELGNLNVEAPYLLRDALGEVSGDYDAVVIDCPPSLSIFTVNALVASGHVVIPLQAEKFSIDGIKGLQGTIESIKRRINPELSILGALVTQLKSHTVLTKTIMPVIQNYFPVFKTPISMGVSIGESHLSRKSIFDYNSSCKQSIEYKELCRGSAKWHLKGKACICCRSI